MADTGTIRVCECHPNADTGPAEGNEGLFSEDTCERDPLEYPLLVLLKRTSRGLLIRFSISRNACCPYRYKIGDTDESDPDMMLPSASIYTEAHAFQRFPATQP